MGRSGSCFSLSKRSPLPTFALLASPFGMKFRALFMMPLLELKFKENGAPGDGRICNPLMPVHVLERSHIFKKLTEKVRKSHKKVAV